MPKLTPDDARVAVGLWRLLVGGAPVTVEALADRLATPPRQVTEVLNGPMAGTYQQDNQDRITAFWALSTLDLPSPHRLNVDGRRRLTRGTKSSGNQPGSRPATALKSSSRS